MGKLNKQQQQVIAALILFVFGGGYFYWNNLLKPTLDSIQEREQKYRDLVSKVEAAERQARRLPALQNELNQLQTELSALENQLPKDKDVPNILRTLTREAIQENLEFMQLTPKPAEQSQYFVIIPFDIQFKGNLHSLARFLASLGQQDRIFQAKNIQLTLAGSSPGDSLGIVALAISLTVQTYAYSG